MLCQLQGGAEKRLHVDAAVLAEAPILVCDERLHEERVDIGKLYRQTPAPVGDREGAEQHALAIDHDAAGFGSEWWQPDLRHRVFQRERRRGSEEAGGEKGAENGCTKAGTASLSPLAGERRRGGKDAAAAVIRPPSLTLPRKGGGKEPRRRRRSIVGLPQGPDHLDLASVRPPTALGPVHVLDQRRRMQECPGRYRAHDVGELELRRSARSGDPMPRRNGRHGTPHAPDC